MNKNIKIDLTKLKELVEDFENNKNLTMNKCFFANGLSLEVIRGNEY